MHPVCGCFTLFWLDRPENWSTCLKPGVLDPDPLACPIRMLLLLLVLLLLLLLLHEKQHWKCKRDEAAAAGPFFSSVFFFLQLFLFVRFGNEFWLLLAGTRFGCTDPVSACYRFDKGQGVRCGVEWTPPPRGNCLLPPLALDCQFSQEFVPPTSIFCWPFYFCRFLCLLCSDLPRCPDVLTYIQTYVCNTYWWF